MAVTFHARPDGDAVASALLFGHGLRRLGKSVLMVTPEGLPSSFVFLRDRVRGLGRIPWLKPGEEGARAELLVVLDAANLERLEWSPSSERFPRLVQVDHHWDNTRFGEAAFVDPAAPATAVPVMRTLRALGLRPGPAEAELLFVALYSDTAGLTVPNPGVVRALEFCIRHGAEIPVLVGLLRRRTLASFRLGARIFGRLDRAAPGVYWTWVTRRDLKATGAVPEAFDAVLEDLGRLEDAEIFFLMKETGPRSWKVSIRSRSADVHHVAAAFGGGGHRRAAGFPIEGGVLECARRILGALRRG